MHRCFDHEQDPLPQQRRSVQREDQGSKAIEKVRKRRRWVERCQGRPECLQNHSVTEGAASMRIGSFTGSEPQAERGVDGRVRGGGIGASDLVGVPVVRQWLHIGHVRRVFPAQIVSREISSNWCTNWCLATRTGSDPSAWAHVSSFSQVFQSSVGREPQSRTSLHCALPLRRAG